MKQQWHVCRTTFAHPAGQQRWDQAYRHLLQWASTNQRVPAAKQEPAPSHREEVTHASSRVCAGVDLASSPPSDD